MISLTTEDGHVHAANDWKDCLRSAVPHMEPGVALGHLIQLCIKTHHVDVTFGDEVTDTNAPQMLARLHECEIVNMDIMLLT